MSSSLNSSNEINMKYARIIGITKQINNARGPLHKLPGKIFVFSAQVKSQVEMPGDMVEGISRNCNS
jgi:hypothetical protein